MWLSDTSVRRPVLATVISLLLVAFGALSFRNLPLRELPDVDPPIVSVETVYRGAASAVIENRITKLIEDRVSGIEGIRTIASDSRDGFSSITIEFELSRDLEAAANDVRDRVSQVLGDLPEEAEPPEIFKAEADAFPIMWLNLESETRDALWLTDYAQRYLVDRFSVVDGVARVRLSGERRYAMRIWLDRVALAARELTVADVESALRAQNVELPAGRIESVLRDFSVRVDRSYRSPEDFAALVLARGSDGYLVRLGDVAKVEVGPEEWRNEFRANGLPRVGVGIVKQSAANTLNVARAALAELERAQPGLPPDISFTKGWDGSEFIQAAVNEVYFTFGIAVLLVVGVIYLFLGTKRAAVVPAVTVPICIVATFSALYAFGLSINLLTLLGLLLSIGLVVDDSIVVLENVQRRIELGETPILAAYRGAREVGFAVVATTAVVIAVFVPIVFMEGISGRLFRELAVTISAAVAFSGIVALSLSAMMCSKLLVAKERDRGVAAAASRIVDRLQQHYRVALTRALAQPWMVWTTVAAVVAATAFLFTQVPAELEPSEDRGAFMVFVIGPEGGSYDYTTAHMRQLEDRVLFPLLETGEVRQVMTRVPGSFGAGAAMSTGFVIMVLSHWDDRELGVGEIMQRIAVGGSQIPGIRAFPLETGGIGGRSGGRPVQVVLGTTTHEEAGAAQEKLLARLGELPGIVAPRGDYQPTRPELRLEIDRSRAADLGVSVAAIGRTLETMLGSLQVTTYVERGEEYEVIVQGREDQRATPNDLTNLYVRSDTTRALIPLSNLVAMREVADAGALRRFARMPAATIEAGLVPGYRLGDALAAIEALAREELPDNVHLDYKGASREFRESTAAAYFSFALALLIVFLVLAAQFESFVHPFVIMLTVPLAVAGGLLGLWLAGGSLNIYSQIGMTILIGLAAKNGILIVEFANQLRERGLAFEDAVREAALTRLRPILMTSIATALGALPLFLRGGPGAGGRGAIGVVVFSGVLVATFFTLFIVPVAYAVLARRTQLPGAVAHELERLERGSVPAGAGGN